VRQCEKKTTLPAPIFTKPTNPQQHYVQICYTEFHQNGTINVGSSGRNTDTDYSMPLNKETNTVVRRSLWPRGLRRTSTAARLLRLWVGIPPGAWTSVCCECCVLYSRGLCDELITRPDESYRLWCVIVWDLETS